LGSILVIDDDKKIRDILTRFLSEFGNGVDVAKNLTEGFDKVNHGNYDIVLLDVNLPDGNGVESIPRMRNAKSAPEIIIMTGEGDPEGAELAIKHGAWDYMLKGSSLQEMILPVSRALQYRAEKLATKQFVNLRRDEIIGDSKALQDTLEQITQASTGDASVLITGETGTGKELFAYAIHANSQRAQNNFVIVDCSAMPDTLVDSMLFGHRKGSFTGANYDHVGLVKQADGGTLFLDEIGELPPAIQKTFLRVLEEQKFRPVGSEKIETSDFRLVAATNRNLQEMVQEGTFREDLLFRLNSFLIELPPLRARRGDIMSITRYHADRLCSRYGIEPKGFSPEFFESLLNYEWPGNVRELVNALEMSVSSARFEKTLFPRHLPTAIRVKLATNSIEGSKAPIEEPEHYDSSKSFPSIKDYRSSSEKKYIYMLMDYTAGDKSRACKVSGLSRASLYNMLKKHDIK